MYDDILAQICMHLVPDDRGLLCMAAGKLLCGLWDGRSIVDMRSVDDRTIASKDHGTLPRLNLPSIVYKSRPGPG